MDKVMIYANKGHNYVIFFMATLFNVLISQLLFLRY